MKPIVSILALVSALIVAPMTFAVDAPSQPLTRSDCDKAGMGWSEVANVCAESNLTAAPTQSSTVFAADGYSQPLTRAECDKAGMRRNERANVCADSIGTLSQPLTRADCGKAGMRWNEGANVCLEPTSTVGQAQPGPAGTKGSSILIAIDKTKQRMSVLINGLKKYDWRVSTGRPGYSTPSGTYTATSMNELWYSKEWDNAPMPHAIFFMTDGHAIHGSYEVKSLGKPVSHGCVRISPQNATILFALVGKTGLKNTQVVLTGVTPGGEYKVANKAGRNPSQKANAASRVGPKRTAAGKPKVASRYAQADPGWYGRGDQFPRRPGFFGRLFGGPSSEGPQGNYRPAPTRGH
jgi:lipoprotein-anchoring transpeptidase ErfK/SrfK